MSWYHQSQNDIHQHLRERGVDPGRTPVYVDPESGVATFPIYDGQGRMVGYQQYNPAGAKRPGNDEDTGRYYTYISDEFKRIGVWGLHTVNLLSDTILFITEGIFDAVKIHNAGYPAIAALGNAASRELKAQVKLWAIYTIGIMDRDEAGSKLAALVDRAVVVPEPYHDLGDMPQEEVNVFLQGLLQGRDS